MDASFQDRLGMAAKLAGSGEVLAQRAGISRRMLSRYMGGGAEPSRDRLVRLADAAGVSVEWLATGRGSMRRQEPSAAKSGPAYGAGNEVVIPAENVPLEQTIAWLRDWWAHATPDERTWMRMQLARTFPEFAEWQKKQEPSSRKQSGA